MMKPAELVKKYVDLSNNGQLELISELIDEDATYSSDNVGIHYGKDSIMEMKNAFFGGFSEHFWEVPSYEEIQSNIIQFDFNFHGKDLNGEEIKRSGTETVVINSRNKIQHVEVRKKAVDS